MDYSIIKSLLSNLLYLINKIFQLFGYKLVIGSYSGKNTLILVFYKKLFLKRIQPVNNSLIGKAKFFEFDIFHQIYDRRAIFYNKWDLESTLVAALAQSSELFSDKDIFDLGSNYGIFSLPYVNDKSINSHILVEANPFLTTCLKKTFNDNQVILNNAITGKINPLNEFVNLNIIPGGSGSSSMDPNIKDKNPFFSYALDVKAITPSLLFQTYKKSNNAVIKMDIEKQELNLLRNGFLETLKKSYDNYVVLIEFLISENQSFINEEFIQYFANYPIILFGEHNWKKNPQRINKNDFLDGRNLNLKKFYDFNLTTGIQINLKNIHSLEILLFSDRNLATKFLKNAS